MVAAIGSDLGWPERQEVGDRGPFEDLAELFPEVVGVLEELSSGFVGDIEETFLARIGSQGRGGAGDAGALVWVGAAAKTTGSGLAFTDGLFLRGNREPRPPPQPLRLVFGLSTGVGASGAVADGAEVSTLGASAVVGAGFSWSLVMLLFSLRLVIGATTSAAAGVALTGFSITGALSGETCALGRVSRATTCSSRRASGCFSP